MSKPANTGAKQAKRPKGKLTNGLDPSVGKATQWKKGQSGNPKGKPKGARSLKTIVRELGEREVDWSKVPVKNAKELGEKYGPQAFNALGHILLAKALSGDMQAIKTINEVVYGKSIDITSDGEPIPLLAGLAPATLEVDDGGTATADDSTHKDK